MPYPSFPVPVFQSMEALPPDSPLRKLHPDDVYPDGSYYVSPNGRVRYWILGPHDGDRVVLIHGISVPSIAYQKIAPFLAEKGYRVLLYDLHGRGYSEAPKKVLETNDYIVQLALLLQHIGWSNVKVVGFSMGGGITAAFTSLFPHLVGGKAVFIASAGLIEIPTDENGIRQPAQPRRSAVPNPLAVELRRLQGELLPGFQSLLENDMRYGPIAGLDTAFESLRDIETKDGKLRALIIHGNEDDIVPLNEAFKIKELIPQAEIVQIEGANHYLVLQEGHWLRVATSIAAFLND